MLCDASDILVLQESWPISQELHIFITIDDRFYVRAKSAMNVSSKVLHGGPHGGTAILWRKDLGGCKVIETEAGRLMCLEFLSDNNAILFINVYMPCDNNDNLDDFLHYLAKLIALLIIILNHIPALLAILMLILLIQYNTIIHL